MPYAYAYAYVLSSSFSYPSCFFMDIMSDFFEIIFKFDYAHSALACHQWDMF